jgi:putative ABC transport system substrate-binding protein
MNKESGLVAQKSTVQWNGTIATILSLTLTIAVMVWPAIAHAQQPAKIPRIGYISGTYTPSDLGPYVAALRRGMRELGYTEGKDFIIEYRGAEGRLDTVPGIIKELVGRKIDVLVLPLVRAIESAKKLTKNIPIVIIAQLDPVAAGFVNSMAKPGGNITGIATLQRDLSGKRLELLSEVVPRLSRVGILRSADEAMSLLGFKEYEAAASALKIQVHSLGISGPNPDLEEPFKEALKLRAGAVITITSNPLFSNSKKVAQLAIRHGFPSMYEGSSWVDVGGLISYSANDIEVFHHAATYVDKILKGVKPADLPIEQPTKFEMVINLKTAKQIGLTIPQKVLVRADRVIR